jgi:hypothetical protein
MVKPPFPCHFTQPVGWSLAGMQYRDTTMESAQKYYIKD